MKISGSVIVIMLIYNGLASAQEIIDVAATEANLKALTSGGTVPVRTFNTGYKGFKGTPYLHDDWKPGTIILNSGDVFNNIPIKFDIYSNNLVYKNPQNGDSVIINKKSVARFNFVDISDDNYFIKIPLPSDNSVYELYFARLTYDGDTKLYNYLYKSILKADYTGAYNANRPYDQFVDNQSLYVQKRDGTLVKIRTGKKAILKALADRKTELKSFMKKTGIQGRDTDELILLLRYYDGLK